MSLTVTLISIFLIGIFLIALEEKIRVNKSATALLMCVAMWVVIALSGLPVGAEVIAEQLGEVSETLFFVMGALIIIELIDIHGGFRVVQDSITTKSQRKLLWVISLLSFFLSAILDNIATAVIMIALLNKFISERNLRWIYACMIIISANAGGAFSPVGDVTTILLWTGGNVTPWHQISHLILPSIVFMIVPLTIATLAYFKKGAQIPPIDQDRFAKIEQLTAVPTIHSKVMLVMGVSTMALLPFFQEWSALPPFMRILLGLAMMWVYTDILYGSKKNVGLPEDKVFKVGKVLTRIDMSTILFFLGILMSVGAMKVSGVLVEVGVGLEKSFNEPLLTSFVIGAMSSFVDNVALVAATQGMYPLAEVGTYMVNSEFWTFLAYCAVTGGSLLIIGSATGVTVMGVEKITFGYYLKRFSLLAILGYIAGAAVFLLLK